MRINHNIAALNTYRQLTGNVGNTGKSLEKLSSGLRINKAGDDAAGLAISEKMRAQIRGLDQATRNASDGISLIQTAEGALTETHSILQRMRELAVQSATDTNTIEDRKEIQKEINNLVDEVDRISKETQFNKQTLLDGGYTGNKFHIGANSDQTLTASIRNMDANALAKGTAGFTEFKAGATATVGAEVTITAQKAGPELNGLKIVFEKTDDGADNSAVASLTGNTLTVSVKGTAAAAGVQTAINTALTAKYGANAVEVSGNATVAGADVTLTLSGGATGIAALKISDPAATANGVLTQTASDKAIQVIDEAIKSVSSERAMLGGIQNRLEHTINNLGATSENLAASESRIRDVDMAKEMMEFTKNNILSQASQAMLAQANMQPQSVLQLLQ
jgi:flagellin